MRVPTCEGQTHWSGSTPRTHETKRKPWTRFWRPNHLEIQTHHKASRTSRTQPSRPQRIHAWCGTGMGKWGDNTGATSNSRRWRPCCIRSFACFFLALREGGALRTRRLMLCDGHTNACWNGGACAIFCPQASASTMCRSSALNTVSNGCLWASWRYLSLCRIIKMLSQLSTCPKKKFPNHASCILTTALTSYLIMAQTCQSEFPRMILLISKREEAPSLAWVFLRELPHRMAFQIANHCFLVHDWGGARRSFNCNERRDLLH